MVNKELVKTRFTKSIKTYDKNAFVQKQMAEVLIQNLFKININFDRILEIGCGTGLLTKKIEKNLSFKELFLNDIILLPSPLEGEGEVLCELANLRNSGEGSKDITFILGNCEEIEFPQNLDLVISNATFQWIEDLPKLCKKIGTNLNNNGLFAFTTFEEGNLHQIKSITGKSLNYYKKSEIESILKQDFKIIYSYSEILDLEFTSIKDVLNHLKATGANALEKIKWTKKDLQEFGNKYNNFKNVAGKFILTYKPLYFICAKID